MFCRPIIPSYSGTDSRYLSHSRLQIILCFWSKMDEHFSTNESISLPSYLKFSNSYAYTIICLGVVFLIGALANIAFFVTLLCSKNRKSPTNFFLLHLSSADLLVMFVIPVGEMIHNATIAWLGGNFLCKLYHFLWNFGQYTTTFLLCCISIDRLLAFVFPLRSLTQSPRTRSLMAATAWLLSAILSAPEVSVSYTSPMLYPLFPRATLSLHVSDVSMQWGELSELVLGLYRSLAHISFSVYFPYCLHRKSATVNFLLKYVLAYWTSQFFNAPRVLNIFKHCFIIFWKM